MIVSFILSKNYRYRYRFTKFTIFDYRVIVIEVVVLETGYRIIVIEVTVLETGYRIIVIEVRVKLSSAHHCEPHILN